MKPDYLEWSEELVNLQSAASSLLAYSNLYNLRDILLGKLVSCVSSDVVAIRTKSLKSIQEILIMKPEILHSPNVYSAISARLSDPSPSVRDAAVDLLSKVLVKGDEESLEKYYRILSERILVYFICYKIVVNVVGCRNKRSKAYFEAVEGLDR